MKPLRQINYRQVSIFGLNDHLFCCLDALPPQRSGHGLDGQPFIRDILIFEHSFLSGSKQRSECVVDLTNT